MFEMFYVKNITFLFLIVCFCGVTYTEGLFVEENDNVVACHKVHQILSRVEDKLSKMEEKLQLMEDRFKTTMFKQGVKFTESIGEKLLQLEKNCTALIDQCTSKVDTSHHFPNMKNNLSQNALSKNKAINGEVFVSSEESADCRAENAVDGVTTTRWSSKFADPQWLYVDLGEPQLITRVKLYWEFAYAKSYQIQISNDTTSWQIYEELNGDGGVDIIYITPSVARYVKMFGIRRGTDYGYSLYELEVY